ncbi:uncharacterized protein LOC121855109 [Homarus americanus]|uniref:uncharacterized protein LOC121855109 n=1 Tax=Homarus americanus TaxID=6706 RepID=UPI001C480216|nr:uncharacterized protein LOC121855109 [Homarus americanus]XP_042205905.1 uncharacterized protein LOC121855109 [Homarus americanus]
MMRHQLILAFLYFVIVLVILPFFLTERVYSIYYQEDYEKSSFTDTIKNEYRLNGAQQYLENVDPETSLTFHNSKLSEPVDNLIIVLAKKATHEKDLILTQLVTEVDKNIRAEKFYRNAMMICNTTRSHFRELDRLARFYPVRQAQNTTRWKLFNTEEVKKHDFVECVNQGINSVNFKYLTLIRDVVVPYSGFLGVLNHLASKRLTRSLVRGDLKERDTSWLFLHLQEPVPFRHYEFTGVCVREILLVACSGAVFFTVVFRWLEGPSLPSSARIIYALYGVLYFLTFALVIGRPYVNEFRRFSADMYLVYDPPEPILFSAIVLPSSSLDVLLPQLNLLQCSKYSPFHEVLDHMISTIELPGYVVSPSLFKYVART